MKKTLTCAAFGGVLFLSLFTPAASACGRDQVSTPLGCQYPLGDSVLPTGPVDLLKAFLKGLLF